MRGIFFTVALVIFGLALLSGAVVFSQGMHSARSRATYTAVIDRIADNKAYVEQGVRDIIRMYDINITTSGNTATITEELPYTRMAAFSAGLDAWRDFVQNKSEFNLSLDVQEMKRSFTIYINDAAYTHPEDMGGNKIDVLKGSNVLAYRIALFVHEELDIKKMTWSASSGANEFGIDVYTNTDSESSTRRLDFTKGSSLRIELKQGSVTHYIDVQVGKGKDPGFLRIDNSDRLNMTVMTSITMKGASAKVMLPGAVLNITDSVHDMGLLTSLSA